jgi:quercetin dioxygenase-like cupin family protein
MDTLQIFRSQVLAEGYDEVAEVRWQPLFHTQTHIHPFDVYALVAEGELTLHREGHSEYFAQGDRFRLARNTEHHESYGERGATLWVARMH